jgi:hypothetical protein
MRATDGAQHLSRCGGSRNFEPVLLYHKLGQRAAAIVAGVADPNFKARLLTLGVQANPVRFGLALDVIFGEVQAARSPGDNPGLEVCLRL